jgi:hypothetical protein
VRYYYYSIFEDEMPLGGVCVCVYYCSTVVVPVINPFAWGGRGIVERPSKQPLMVRTFLKVYMELDSSFLFLQEQIKDIIINMCYEGHSDEHGCCVCLLLQDLLYVFITTELIIKLFAWGESDNGDPLYGIIYCRWL